MIAAWEVFAHRHACPIGEEDTAIVPGLACLAHQRLGTPTRCAHTCTSAGKRGSKCECFPLSSSCTGYVEMSALGNNRAKLIEAPFVTDVADTPRHPGHAGCPTTIRPGDRCPKPAKREVPPGSIRRMRLTQQYPDLPVGSWQLLEPLCRQDCEHQQHANHGQK